MMLDVVVLGGVSQRQCVVASDFLKVALTHSFALRSATSPLSSPRGTLLLFWDIPWYQKWLSQPRFRSQGKRPMVAPQRRATPSQPPRFGPPCRHTDSKGPLLSCSVPGPEPDSPHSLIFQQHCVPPGGRAGSVWSHTHTGHAWSEWAALSSWLTALPRAQVQALPTVCL